MRSPRLVAAILVVPLLVLGACGDDESGETSGTSDSTTTTTTTNAASESTSTTAAVVDETIVARAEVDVVDVYDTVDATVPAQQLDRRQETTGNLVFVVEASADDRYRVELPVRPNGSVGWVDAADVSLTRHQYRVEIDLGGFELRVYEAGDEILATPIGVGTQDTPTPGGTYYIKELLQPPTPEGPYGTYAYGLSGYSNVLQSFGGGDGVIGIHGTDRPELIGTEVSHGCIRMENGVISRMVEEIGLPLGVPVEINA